MLERGRLSGASYERRTWRYTAPDGQPLKELLDAAHWASLAGSLSPGDLVEVTDENLTFFALLIVRFKTHAAVSLAVLVHQPRLVTGVAA